MSNLDFWNDVADTDPEHAKKVNQRGGFTAIDAHYQVKSATEAFGMVGKGWGYDCNYVYQNTVVICELTFWYVQDGKRNSFGPIAGCSDMFGKKLDTDAPKKAMTDALTKSLSHLGFNADVFMGLFDDNKYVADKSEQFAKEKFYKAELERIGDDIINEYHALVGSGDVIGLGVFLDKYKPKDENDHTLNALWESWPKGKKSVMHKKQTELQGKFYPMIQQISGNLIEAIGNQDDQGIVECWDELPEIKKFLMANLSDSDREYLKQRAASKAEDEAIKNCRSAV